MFKHHFAIAFSLLLVGCVSDIDQITLAPIAESQVCCSAFNEFPYIELQRDESISVNIDETSPVGDFADGRSHFVAFKLSNRSKNVSVALRSKLVNGQAFSPKLIALDENFNLVSQTTSEQFELSPSNAFTGTQFKTNLILDAERTPYIVIYTTEEELGKIITVEHPAKVRAREFGEVTPMTLDPKYIQGYFGQLELDIKTNTYRTATAITTKSEAQALVVLQETENYYLQQIRIAVQHDNIPKALALLEEAKKLNITSAQQAFVSAVNSD